MELVSVRDIINKGIVKRVQVVNDIRFGNLPAQKIGNSYVIKKEDADRYIKWKLELKKKREERKKLNEPFKRKITLNGI